MLGGMGIGRGRNQGFGRGDEGEGFRSKGWLDSWLMREKGEI